jgi:hypothetical protein
MSWLHAAIDRLESARDWSYHANGPAATEPTALAALALAAHKKTASAQRALDWLTRAQAADGTLGVTIAEKTPCWPTALAVLAWQAWDEANGSSRYAGCTDRAARWLLSAQGNTSERSPLIGHDTTLVGWPWVLGTHSWLEPTAYAVLALKAAGHAKHARTREALRLLVDRLLPSGGCNYGNTIVMGQELLPHVQPTGLVLLALAAEDIKDPRLERSLLYLEQSIAATTALPSLAFALLGLSAFGRRPAAADAWLDAASRRPQILGPSAYSDALAALAAIDDDRNPFLQRPA